MNHTDNTGGSSYNLDLSEKRAKSVAEYMGERILRRKELEQPGTEKISQSTRTIRKETDHRIEEWNLPFMQMKKWSTTQKNKQLLNNIYKGAVIHGNGPANCRAFPFK